MTYNNNSGIINSYGALNGFSKRAEKHAKMYYESVRHMKTDIAHIAQNTGFTEVDIKAIKEHVFLKEHDIDGIMRRFDESYFMAESWQRLIQGDNIQEQDIVLLRHELLEIQLEASGLTHDEAHEKAQDVYNYSKYIPDEDDE